MELFSSGEPKEPVGKLRKKLSLPTNSKGKSTGAGEHPNHGYTLFYGDESRNLIVLGVHPDLPLSERNSNVEGVCSKRDLQNPTVVESSGSSFQQASLKRKIPQSFNRFSEKKRLKAEKFLKEPWRNFLNSSARMDNVLSSSTKGDEAWVNEILDAIHDNLLNGISPQKDQKTTSAQDFDEEEVAHLIADLNQAIEGTKSTKIEQ